jgi:hypothetical protein
LDFEEQPHVNLRVPDPEKTEAVPATAEPTA